MRFRAVRFSRYTAGRSIDGSVAGFVSRCEEKGLRARIRPFLIIAIVSAVLLGAVLLLHSWKNIPIGRLTGDPVALAAGLPVYSGFLSQIGILFWSASASICFFCRKVLHRSHVDKELKRFLTVSGAFTLWLALDDMFLFHETVLPILGIPQNAVLGSYVVFTLAYLFTFRRTILETNFLVLVFSLSFFAMSVILDVFKPFKYSLTFFEEGAKLVGLVGWTVYFIGVGEYAIGSASDKAKDHAHSLGIA